MKSNAPSAGAGPSTSHSVRAPPPKGDIAEMLTELGEPICQNCPILPEDGNLLYVDIVRRLRLFDPSCTVHGCVKTALSFSDVRSVNSRAGFAPGFCCVKPILRATEKATFIDLGDCHDGRAPDMEHAPVPTPENPDMHFVRHMFVSKLEDYIAQITNADPDEKGSRFIIVTASALKRDASDWLVHDENGSRWSYGADLAVFELGVHSGSFREVYSNQTVFAYGNGPSRGAQTILKSYADEVSDIRFALFAASFPPCPGKSGVPWKSFYISGLAVKALHRLRPLLAAGDVGIKISSLEMYIKDFKGFRIIIGKDRQWDYMPRLYDPVQLVRSTLNAMTEYEFQLEDRPKWDMGTCLRFLWHMLDQCGDDGATVWEALITCEHIMSLTDNSKVVEKLARHSRLLEKVEKCNVRAAWFAEGECDALRMTIAASKREKFELWGETVDLSFIGPVQEEEDSEEESDHEEDEEDE